MHTATTSGATFKCPVCRARQPLQIQCRRCRADLSLVVSARCRLAYLKQQRNQPGHPTISNQAIDDEIRWLDPSTNLNEYSPP